jgi:hypothetical protein
LQAQEDRSAFGHGTTPIAQLVSAPAGAPARKRLPYEDLKVRSTNVGKSHFKLRRYPSLKLRFLGFTTAFLSVAILARSF